MKISKKVREEAAILLSIAACSNGVTLGSAALATGASKSARELAFYTYYSARWVEQWRATYAEAESLLRTGSSPGDEV